MVDLPFDLFSQDRGATNKLKGRTFSTIDRRADVSLYSIPNEAGQSPYKLFSSHFQLPQRSLVYRKANKSIFAISGYRGDKIWYVCCNFATV